MIMIRPAADHRCTAENVPLSTAESTMKAVRATITAASATVAMARRGGLGGSSPLASTARPGEAEVTARPPCGSSMISTLRPERSGNVTAGTAEGDAGADTQAVRDHDGRDRCGRIVVDGT